MVSTNASLKELGNKLADAGSVLLFPHVNPDPDSIGSCMALCRVLRQMGKRVWILLDRQLPDYLQFLSPQKPDTSDDARSGDSEGDPGTDPDGNPFTRDPEIFLEPDVCVMVDCSEKKRITGRETAFHAGSRTLCIDHHLTAEWPYDHYYIDPDSAATAILVYRMIREMDWSLDCKAAGYIYAGIVGDTGCFMHSNTTPEVHRIAADLQESGVDINYFNVKLYQSRDLRSVKVSVMALQAMELLADGRAVLSKLSAEDFSSCDADVDHADTVIDDLRMINGVEIAAFLKEDGDKVRGNLRSKTDANVALIAEKFGGGGHVKAAGFTTDMTLEETYGKLREELLLALQ